MLHIDSAFVCINRMFDEVIITAGKIKYTRE